MRRGRALRTVRRYLERATGVERFVRLVVAGGLALVAGLWLARLSPGRPVRLAGVAVALLGVGGLAAGIRAGIDTDPGAGS